MKIRDSLGWPVETFKNRPILNFFRYLLHGSLYQTIKLRNWDDQAEIAKAFTEWQRNGADGSVVTTDS